MDCSYVGERGTWYPNTRLSPAQFDMEFHYPANWTLLATENRWRPRRRGSGKEWASGAQARGDNFALGLQSGPIPVAGFNLGKYVRAKPCRATSQCRATDQRSRKIVSQSARGGKSALRPFPAGERSVRSPSLRRRRRPPAMLRPWPTRQPGNRELLAVVWPYPYGSWR